METARALDFRAGLFSHVDAGSIAPSSSLRLADQVLLAPDGKLRSRGRIKAFTFEVLADVPIFVWGGHLLSGDVTVFVAAGGLHGVDLYTADNTGAVSYGTFDVSGLTEVVSAVVIGNILWMTAPDGTVWLYAGSQLGSAFSDVLNTTVTLNSPTVTTTSSFAGQVDVGSILQLGGAGDYAVVKSIQSNTSLTLDRPSDVATATSTRRFWRVASAQFTGTGPLQLGAAAGRMLRYRNAALTFSNGPDPTTGGTREQSAPPQNIHSFPPDAVGVTVQTLRDRVFVFTTRGLFIVSNMSLEITDGSGNPQHPIEQYSSGDLICVSGKGVATWQNALIVPCRDAIYVVDGISPPINISRGIPWAQHIADGAVIGWATVHRGYYLLPITVNGATFTYLINLSAIETEMGTFFPTTRLTTTGGPLFDGGKDIVAWSSVSATSLLSLGYDLVGQATGIFDEPNGVGDDYNHLTVAGFNVAPVIEKHFELGPRAVVRRVRVRYRYTQSTGGTVTVTVYRGDNSTILGTAQLAGESDGTGWTAFDLDAPAMTNAVRVRVEYAGATPVHFDLLGLEVQYVSSGLGL